MIDNFKAWLLSKKINRAEVNQHIERECRIISQSCQNLGDIGAINDDSWVVVCVMALDNLTSKGRSSFAEDL